MTDRLKNLCDRFRLLMRRLLLLLGASRVVCFAWIALVSVILVDFFWHFGQVERFVALAALLGVVGWVVLRDLVQPLRQSWSDKEVLHYLDSALPANNDRLTNID